MTDGAVMSSACRTCLAQTGKYDIFQTTSLLQMLTDCVPIKFTDSECLPRSLCEICMRKLEESHSFLNQVISSHNTLCTTLNIPLVYQRDTNWQSVVKEEQLKHEILGEINMTEIKCEQDDVHTVTYTRSTKVKSRTKKNKHTRSVRKFNVNALRKNAVKKYSAQENTETNNQQVLSRIHVDQELSEADGNEIQKEFSDITSDIVIKAKLTCRYCCQTFADSNAMKDHYTLHKNEEETCSMCGKIIRSRNMILQHKKRHSKIPCEYCGEFLNMYYIRKHVKARHSNWKKECPICNVILTSPEYFKIHVKSHSERAKFKCEICKKEVGSKASYRWHMRSHTNIRPYKCRFCDKTFVLSKTKKEHECIHTGARPYGCPLCDKTFIQKSNLKGHFVHIHKEYNYSDYSSKIIFKSISKV